MEKILTDEHRKARRLRSNKTARAIRDVPYSRNRLSGRRGISCSELRQRRRSSSSSQDMHSDNNFGQLGKKRFLVSTPSSSVEVIDTPAHAINTEEVENGRNNKYKSISHASSFSLNLQADGEVEANAAGPIIRGIDVTEASQPENKCDLQLTNMCTWPHCNPTCPTLIDPYTGMKLL